MCHNVKTRKQDKNLDEINFLTACNCKCKSSSSSSSSHFFGGGGRSYYLSTDSVYVKVEGHNLRVLHRCHVSHCWSVNDVSYRIWRFISNRHKKKTKCRLHPAATLLFHILKNTYARLPYFSNILCRASFQNSKLSDASVAGTWFKIVVRPPCCYKWLEEIKNYVTGMFSNGITFTLNFVRICPLVQNLKGDAQTHTLF
jgi:hypothetical protein